MGFNAELLAFSENPHGDRLATFLVTMPRSILAETNTHRMLSRNAASSRAIPTRIMLDRIMNDPYIPEFGMNCSGMHPNIMDENHKLQLQVRWLMWRNATVDFVTEQITPDDKSRQPHKGDINRLLEPFLFMEWIVSGTEWENFFFQRCHTAAHPAFQEVAYRMAKLFLTTQPRHLEWGEGHLPFITDEDQKNASVYNYPSDAPDYMVGSALRLLEMVSAARCGRVSYSKQDKKDIEKDLEWFHRHIYQNAAKGEPQHVSPAEHPAIAIPGKHANYYGFEQLRSTIPNENHTKFGIKELNQYEHQTGREITIL